MLAPKDTATRERRSLDGLWKFMLDPDGTGRRDRWYEQLPPGAVEMPVPSSYNDVLADPAGRDHVGDVWYETSFRIPPSWAGRRIAIRFGSATHRADVWVNGQPVAVHQGGYTPFEADITAVATPGQESRVTVAVSNVLTWQTIPPGYLEDTAGGRRDAEGLPDNVLASRASDGSANRRSDRHRGIRQNGSPSQCCSL